MKEEKVIVRFDGTIPLRPEQKPYEAFLEKKQVEKEKNKLISEGDNSCGIEGKITLRDKQSAIIFVNGIIDTFEIERDELDV